MHLSRDTWRQIKAAYAAGIGLREIARKMNVPAGTVLARAAHLTQIARCAAFVLHDARAADHFQVGNPGQMGQDLVLDALGEEGVCFFFAQIFEWKDRDRRLAI